MGVSGSCGWWRLAVMGAGGSKKGKKVGLKCLKMDFKDMVFL